jgi:hypothetical protein
MNKPELSKLLITKYPKYYLTHILDTIGESISEEKLANKLCKNQQIYFAITERQYTDFIHSLDGIELDAVRGYSFLNSSNNYIYNRVTMRIIARIAHTKLGTEYYLAVG